jgi:hypothetical protein
MDLTAPAGEHYSHTAAQRNVTQRRRALQGPSPQPTMHVAFTQGRVDGAKKLGGGDKRGFFGVFYTGCVIRS